MFEGKHSTLPVSNTQHSDMGTKLGHFILDQKSSKFFLKLAYSNTWPCIFIGYLYLVSNVANRYSIAVLAKTFGILLIENHQIRNKKVI